MRLDYVSPLPPVRSGIADYSVDLLPHLAARADVRLIRLPEQPVAPEVEARWPVAPFEAAGRDAQGERLPLYQMGNNRWHEGVMRLAFQQPGVLTLHDILLHHILLDVTLGRQEFEPYVERLTRDHGWIGRAAALVKRWGAYGDAVVFALPAHRALLRSQRGVLVHSEWAAGVIREEDTEIRVRAIHMGIPLPPPADPAAGRRIRERFGLPLGKPVLGSFGFQTPIKRTGAVVRALARPGLEDVHLLVVGEVSPAVDLEGEARRAGVADRVHLTDFLPYEDFEAAIAGVDLCLNLRYPTAGETSASLLRVLALGVPAIVSDYAQFADLPHEVALRVPLGDDEVDALTAMLRDLLARPERLRAMGEAARELVRSRHDPARSAEAVLDAAREWSALPPPGPLPDTRDHPAPSSLAWGRLDGMLEVEGAELPWPEGERRRLRIRLRNTGFARWLAGEKGPGGVAVVVKLFAGSDSEGVDLLEGRPWLALRRDLPPGEEAVFETEVRRPPGPAWLWIEPHLFGGLGLSKYGGPHWERHL